MIYKFYQMFDNYILCPLLAKPSCAQFWYLPENATITSNKELESYHAIEGRAPFYPVNYRHKLQYKHVNVDNIITLPYANPIGPQINPEAAFQYALGLHDQFLLTQKIIYLDEFIRYATYFREQQSKEGYWHYTFDWFESKSPWYSALAQSRGASVMLRAWMHTSDKGFLDAITAAIEPFTKPITEGGLLHHFVHGDIPYYEEYPSQPSAVINGFMAALISLWELMVWLDDKTYHSLWQQGINSLELMLPHYTKRLWSIYDLDSFGFIPNFNSPHYHNLELNYLTVLKFMSQSPVINKFLTIRQQQNRLTTRLVVVPIKVIKKLCYR